MKIAIERMSPRENAFLVPQPITNETGAFQVDVTWGTIQPMQVAEGVQTIGEVELLARIAQGLPVIDCRTRNFYVDSTLQDAKNIPYEESAERIDELAQDVQTVFFCNGPQCGQSPTAIKALLEAGFPADKILYYRGGMHDWLTLGLPVVSPA